MIYESIKNLIKAQDEYDPEMYDALSNLIDRAYCQGQLGLLQLQELAYVLDQYWLTQFKEG